MPSTRASTGLGSRRCESRQGRRGRTGTPSDSLGPSFPGGLVFAIRPALHDLLAARGRCPARHPHRPDARAPMARPVPDHAEDS